MPMVRSCARSLLLRELATLLLGFAWHAQGRTREGQKTILADRVAARLADAVGAVDDPLEGMFALFEHHARVVGQRDLLLTLERLGSGVGLVIAGTVTGVSHETGQLRLGHGDLEQQAGDVSFELSADRGELPGRPRCLVFTDAQGPRLGCGCLLYTSPSPRDRQKSRMPSSA